MPPDAENSSTDSIAPSLLADLCELASYYRSRGLAGCELTESELLFLVGLVRYRFAPPHGTILLRRGHIMVFGGAGAGKSTTSNILAGVEAVEANAQAGYTRHPVAVYSNNPESPPQTWPTRLGDLARIDGSPAGSLDEDRFSIRIVSDAAVDPEFLRSFVVWDCPDLTTHDAARYSSRVVEIAALADVCVYVASDERYNDEAPTRFLQLVLSAGKPTIAALTKMSEFDAEELTSLFRRQVLSGSAGAERVLDVLPIPAPLGGKASQLHTAAFPHGRRLRELVRSALADLEGVRRRAREAAVRLLSDRQAALLEPLAFDVGQWNAWAELVRRSANAAVARYETEYLDRVPEEDFARSLDALIRVFALSGRAAKLWKFLEYLRVPYRAVKAFADRYVTPSSGAELDESKFLHSIREQLMDSLLVGVAARRASHPFWEALHADLLKSEDLPVETAFREVRARHVREMRLRSREASERLESWLTSSERLIPVLRVARLALDASAVGAAVYCGWLWFEGWSLWILVFAAVALGVVDDLVRIACREVVRRQREDLSRRRKENVRELFRAAYVDVLTRLPKGLGERLERLSGLCNRIPQSIRRLQDRLERSERARDDAEERKGDGEGSR
jgi:hypothetical protein